MSQYFNTTETNTLCRDGMNGPHHPSQLKGLSLVDKGSSMLDVGCGSGTTLEAIQRFYPEKEIKYKGVDAVGMHIDWCKQKWPEEEFEQQDGMKLKEKDNSWDVVWSRHVVDHMASFEEALTEHIRVAKKKVICILWYSFSGSDTHEINKVHYDKDYVEYLNTYGETPVKEFLKPYNYHIYKNIGMFLNEGDVIIEVNL